MYPPTAAGRGTNYRGNLIDRLVTAGIYRPPLDVPEEDTIDMPPVTSRPGRLFNDDHFDQRFEGTRVQGDGLPPDPESEMAISGLREATGNLAPMLGRYGVGGYGNIDRSGGRTRVTIHGDPVEAEATRVRAMRDSARRAGDLNRQLALSRAQMIGDSRRMDPNDAARYERDSVYAADAASPDIPDAPGMRGVDELAAIRALLTRSRTGNVIDRERAVSGARTFMDPTVTQARGVARAERGEETERDIAGRVRAQLAGNPEAAFMPELRRLLGLDGGGETGDTGAGATDTMTRDELLDFAADNGMTPEQALQYVQRHGIMVQ